MLKKLMTGTIVAGALLAFVGTASGDTYNVAIGGASAQGKFWKTASKAFMTTQLGCADAKIEGLGKKEAFTWGTTCTNVPGGTGNDEVYFFYTQVASDWGCTNAPGKQQVTQPDPTTCDYTTEEDWDCTDTQQLGLTIGCSDVQCTSITQTSTGWEDGRAADWGDNESYLENCQTGNCTSSKTSYGQAAGFGWDTSQYPNMVEASPFNVTFGFSVNNSVTKTRCTAPVYDSADHVSYNKWGWQCVKGAQRCDTATGQCEVTGDACIHDTRYENDASGNVVLMDGACPPAPALADASADCVSYFKCVEGSCAGGERDGLSCTAAEDCPSVTVGALDSGDNTCTEMPIDNLSRLQALLIFSDQVNNWQDFGPWYPDLPIVQCMRHAGSGTHATLELAVFRGDASIWPATVGGAGPFWEAMESPEATDPNGSEPVVWHYRSSTDLTEDCIEFYNGGVGYVDADKVLSNDDVNNCHTVKFEGVEPTREKVKWGEYTYWGGQSCFYDDDQVNGVEQNLADAILAYAGDPANMNNVDFGQKANYWSTDGEMTVKKSSDSAYPTPK